jgi:PKD repeat protein
LNANGVTNATWNHTAEVLTHGSGGNLLLTGDITNATSQYCIWQEVELKAGMKYTFNAAFRDLSENLDHFWSEVFIGTSAPVDGADYGEGTTKIAFFNTWDCGAAPGLDGTYQENACGDDPKGVFIPEADGTYYFALKTGVTDWEGNTYSFSVMIDEVTFKESENTPAAVADFFADVTSGDAPLTVMFTDLSSNATAWAWDFGDGNTSTEQSPTHTYTTDGVYSVTLVASNDGSSDTLVVDDLITVGAVGVEDIENPSLTIYPNPSEGQIHISLPGISVEKITILDLTGKTVQFDNTMQTFGTLSIEIPKQGIYFVKIQSEDQVFMKKILIQK